MERNDLVNLEFKAQKATAISLKLRNKLNAPMNTIMPSCPNQTTEVKDSTVKYNLTVRKAAESRPAVWAVVKDYFTTQVHRLRVRASVIRKFRIVQQCPVEKHFEEAVKKVKELEHQRPKVEGKRREKKK